MEQTDFAIDIIAGENDFYRDRQVRLTHCLDSLRIPLTYQIIPALGHDLPENFEDYLLNSIRDEK